MKILWLLIFLLVPVTVQSESLINALSKGDQILYLQLRMQELENELEKEKQTTSAFTLALSNRLYGDDLDLERITYLVIMYKTLSISLPMIDNEYDQRTFRKLKNVVERELRKLEIPIHIFRYYELSDINIDLVREVLKVERIIQ